MNEITLPGKNSLKWMVRRGMLELDLLLNNFVDHGYDELSPDLKQAFILLLKEQDPTLQSWFFDGKPTNNPVFESLVAKIKANPLNSQQR